MLTVADIRQKLQTNQDWLERGILAIDARQTEDERQQDQTKHLNGRGWTYGDARRGSYYARWIRSGRRLNGRHVFIAQRMMRKYAGQLLRVAEEKAALAQKPLVTVKATARPQGALPAPRNA
jgi:hypothetical protein